MPTTKATQRRDVSTEIAYLTRALKLPPCVSQCPRLSSRPAPNWSHEEYLAACLRRNVSQESRVAASAPPASSSKSLEEFI